MCFRTKGDRLPRCHSRAGNIKNGPKEDTGCGRLVSTDHCHRSMPILRVYRILPIFHPKLLKDRTTPFRSHKKDNSMALGQSPVQSLRDFENPHVSKTRTPPTKLHKMLLPPNGCLCLWHGHHTLASGRT